MRSSSLNWPSRSSGSSHLNAASLICAALTLRFSVFSATCDIGGLLPYSVTLRCERSEPRRAEARRAQPHPSRAAARPPQDDGMFPGKLRSLRSVRQGWPRCWSRSVSIFRGQAPVAQLDRALPSEGRGQGFESLRARHLRTKPRICAVSGALPAMTAASEAEVIEFRHRYVASWTYRFALLMAAAAAVVGIKAITAPGARAGHGRAARRADGEPRQKRWTVDDPRRGNFRIVVRQPLLDAFKKFDRDDSRHGDFDDGSGIVERAGSGIPHSIGPFARRVAGIGQDLMHRADAE